MRATPGRPKRLRVDPSDPAHGYVWDGLGVRGGDVADAAGSATQLPSTGMPLLPLLAGGVGLLLAGALLRRRTRVS